MIVFRCDANAALGFGHLMRCSQLSAELRRRGHKTAVYGDVPERADETDPLPFDRIERSSALSDCREDADGLMDFAAAVGARALIVDHLDAGGDYQSRLKSRKARWLHFMARPDAPLLADLIFCANAAADRHAFESLDRSPETELLVGLEYALLRPQFRGRERSATRDRVDTVFVSFGGGSDRGAFRKVLPALLSASHDNCRFTLVTGSGNPDTAWLKRFASARPLRVDLRIDETQIADLMLAADLAVMASGTTTLEAAACRLPMILLAIAANQIEPAEAWARRGAAVYLGDIDTLSPDTLIEAVHRLQAPQSRESYTRALQETGVDGRGVSRVADAVERRLLGSYERQGAR